MKILGKAGNDYIAQFTMSEMAKFCGSGARYSNTQVTTSLEEVVSRSFDSLEIGDIVEVSDLYQKNAELREAWDEVRGKLNSFKATVTKLHNAVSDIG